MKLALRHILRLSLGRAAWPLLADITDGLAEQAAAVGSALQAVDVAAGRKRDQLSTGLPRTDSPDSQERFISQIVAKIVRGGTVHAGAISAYGFVEIEDGRIGLTADGARFAKQPNPVLDADLRSVEATLSTEERKFLVVEIVPKMRAELQDFRLVVDGLRRGHTNPETLHNAIEQPLTARRWTPAMVRTHISGLVSRMVELEVVGRSWEGRNVTYSLGPLAAMLPGEPMNTAHQGAMLS
jgi:hypothetical protein